MPPFHDDLDGREADLAVSFGIDGVVYRIRLSVEHAADLYELFAPLRDKAERIGLVTGLESPEIPLPAVEYRSRRVHWAAARDWAAARGIDLSADRQPPMAVVAAFDLEDALERRDREAREGAAGP